MTSFQEQCIYRCSLISGKNIKFAEIVGDSETYYLSETIIGKHSLTIYVYIDEAEFKIDNDWYIFETPDYGSEDVLLNAFIDKLSNTLNNIS